VADDGDRKWRSLGTHRRDEALQVVQQMLEAAHVTAGSTRPAVALLVVGVNLEAGAGEI
jgi:hypothetical protein